MSIGQGVHTSVLFAVRAEVDAEGASPDVLGAVGVALLGSRVNAVGAPLGLAVRTYAPGCRSLWHSRHPRTLVPAPCAASANRSPGYGAASILTNHPSGSRTKPGSPASSETTPVRIAARTTIAGCSFRNSSVTGGVSGYEPFRSSCSSSPAVPDQEKRSSAPDTWGTHAKSQPKRARI